MNPLRLVFFGTQEFAKTILNSLVQDTRYDIVLVITQPDKPVGRKHVLTPPPVKVFCESKGIAYEQPESLKKYTFSLPDIDIAVVAQYGKILPKTIINAPRFGTINVHTSLLPLYRGASPIQSALIDGQTETGVTIMKMDEGMDTGPLLTQQKIAIPETATYQELDTLLADVGATLLLATLPQYISGQVVPQPQNEQVATMCQLLTREDGGIAWHKKTATEIYNQYRGMTPWPGVWTLWQGKRIKFLSLIPHKQTLPPGQVFFENNSLLIGTVEGAIEIQHVQLEGKNPMDAHTFVRGYPHFVGSVLGV
ncbi:MAG: methionyl-tRNA formyltransferase [Candidatus Magasanikbacteria bacterium]|nr:methionyl-tRNA formyltransferase [Candidatus Magasanikbacteria bacterium]